MRNLFLFLILAVTSTVNAQFYDSADDIYFYVEYYNGSFVDDGIVRVFNFDGKTAAVLNNSWRDELGGGPWPMHVSHIKTELKKDPNFFEQQVENTEYNVKFISSNKYEYNYKSLYYNANPAFPPQYGITKDIYMFSIDREFLTISSSFGPDNNKQLKRVPKSFFRVGRQRTPNSGMVK